MSDSAAILVALAIALAVAYGLSWWTYRARTDRSANVGLLLVLGAPGFLIAIYGLATLVNGNADGAIWLLAGLGLTLPLLPKFRKLMARFTPMDPDSPIDMVGLSVLLGVMGFLGGGYAVDPEPVDTGSSVSAADLSSQFLAFMVLAYIIVGTGIWRSFPEATARLGVRKPTGKQLGIAVGFVVLGFAVMITAGALTYAFQPDFNEEINQATQGITESVTSPVGAVLFGLGAGASEELLIRGALQPRFGIPICAVLFALLHNQYGVSFVLLGVLGMGFVLGYERKRYGTVPAILTHALFNTVAVLLGS